MSVDLTISGLTGDFTIVNGKLSEITGVLEVRQRILTRVQKQLGEWRYNMASGVPWSNTATQAGILGSKNSTDQVRSIIAGVVSATDGVTGVKVLQVTFDTPSRGFNIQMEVATIYGTTTLSL